MAERVWFYLVRNETTGPVSELVLHQLAAVGHIFAETYVWTDGMSGWTPFAEVNGLAGVAPAAPAGQVPEPPDRMTRMLLPVGRSGWAIAAGYLGLVSVLFIPAPIAVATGIAGLRDIRKNDQLYGRGRAIFGIVMGSIFTLLLAIGLLALGLG